jgi:hypothetical protein
MSKGQIIGHITCPLDGKDAQVKLDKNEHAYAFCPDCTLQLLTHGGQKEVLLRQVMRPVTPTVREPEPTEAAPVPVPKPKPAAPAPKPVAVTTTPAPAPAEKAGWFTPLIGKK